MTPRTFPRCRYSQDISIEDVQPAWLHSVREEASGQRKLSTKARFAVTVTILIGSVFVANRIGLVSLIANGYRFLAYLFLAIFVVPVMTYGLWQVCRRPSASTGLADAQDR